MTPIKWQLLDFYTICKIIGCTWSWHSLFWNDKRICNLWIKVMFVKILVNVCKSQGSPQGCVNILKEVLMRLSPALSPNTHFKVQNFQNIKKCILRTPHSPNTLFKLIVEIIPNEYFSHLSKHWFQSWKCAKYKEVQIRL